MLIRVVSVRVLWIAFARNKKNWRKTMMDYGDSVIYRLPRWPLFKHTLRVITRIGFGMVVISLFVLYPWNWIGVVFIIWGLWEWRSRVRPQWLYFVQLDNDGIGIEKRRYIWADITGFHLERLKGRQQILRLQVKGNHEITITNNVERFDQLVQRCLSYISRGGVEEGRHKSVLEIQRCPARSLDKL